MGRVELDSNDLSTLPKARTTFARQDKMNGNDISVHVSRALLYMFVFVYISVYLCIRVNVPSVGVPSEIRKRASNPSELVLQLVVSCLM